MAKIRRNLFLNILWLAIIIGTVVGIIVSLSRLLSHRYIQYKMFRLAGSVLRDSLNEAILFSIIAVLALFILYILILYGARFLWNSVFSRIFEFRVKDKNKLKILISVIVSVVCFVLGGWSINYYLLPGRFHPISLLGDVGILLLTILLGWILVKINWDTFLRTSFLKWTAFVLILLVVLMNIWMFIDNQKGPDSPNVILISIETTRADHLGCYGYKRMTSPVIDNLAGEGAMFLNMHVQRGETWPSLTSMMTSLYPVNHGVRHNGHMLPPSKISLAEILKNNKYRCGAFLTNAVYAKWRGFDHKFANAEESEDDVKATQKAIEWLKDQHDKKLFLWIHYWQPHRPYQPPLPYDRIFDPDYTGRLDGSNYQMNEITLKKLDLDDADLNHIISLYDGSILFIDDQIKLLFQTLDDLGIKENSIIIVTADHGEDLYQHNYYFYHSGSVYSSSLRIPFIIKLPDQRMENKKIEEIVQGIDIAPTILDLLDISIPEHFEGQTLKSLILSESPVTGSGVAYSEWGNKILTIRTDRYRYVYNPTGFHPHPIAEVPEIAYPIDEEELYDVMADPLESANRVSEKSQIAQDLLKKLSSWNHFETWLSSEIDTDQKIPEEVLERLRSLGYIK